MNNLKRDLTYNGIEGYNFYVLNKTTKEITHYKVPHPELEMMPKQDYIIFINYKDAKEVREYMNKIGE